MKTKVIIAITVFSLSCIRSQAQAWLQSGNVVSPGSFLGSTNNLGFTLNTNNIPRMIIQNGNTLPGAGYIGMGNNLPGGFTPTARLHLHESGNLLNQPNPFLRFTTAGPASTGALAADGYEMGIGISGDAHLINRENNQTISIHTNDKA